MEKGALLADLPPIAPLVYLIYAILVAVDWLSV
jgi:hypothetical protein